MLQVDSAQRANESIEAVIQLNDRSSQKAAESRAQSVERFIGTSSARRLLDRGPATEIRRRLTSPSKWSDLIEADAYIRRSTVSTRRNKENGVRKKRPSRI